MAIALFIAVVALFAWAHITLERNANRTAKQLQDQLNSAVERIADLERQLQALDLNR